MKNEIKKQQINNNIIDKNTSVIKLGWPIFIEALLAMLIGNVDSLMLSNYSETAVAAVGNANQILRLLVLAFDVIATATGVIVAQYIGARKREKLNEIYSVSMFFNIGISVFVGLTLIFGSKTMFTLMQIDKSLMNDALSYIKILGGGIFLQSCFSVMAQILRSNGRTKVGMYASMVTNLINIVGNYMFLYGPLKIFNLGVIGVAISSNISRLLSLMFMIWYFHKYVNGKISIKYLKPFPVNTLKKMLGVGVPIVGESVSYNISQVLLMSIMNTFGIIAVNTNIYVSIISCFSYLFALAMSQANQIIVGHLIGSGHEDDSYKRTIKTFKISLVISVLIATLNFSLGKYTISLFTSNQQSINLGIKILMIGIILEMGRSTNLVIIKAMRAAGDNKFPTYLGMASMWIVSVLGGFILGKALGLGLIGIWIAMAADECIRGIIVFIRWKKGSWRGKSLTK